MDPAARGANSAKYSFGYDDVDQLRDATAQDTATQAVLKRYTYRYDPAGNRATEQVDNMVATERPNDLNQLTSRTPGGRMKVQGTLTEPARVTINGVQAQVGANNQFDGSAPVTSGTNQFEVAATDGNRNTATQRYQMNVPAASSVTQAHDANGNLVSKTEGGQATTYEWDAADRLHAINLGAHRTELEYDGHGRRTHLTERDTGTVTSEKRFLWCGNELCEERDATGGTVTKRFFGQGEQRVGGIDAGLYFYTRDHLGSIRELTDTGEVVRARYDYTPWGQRSKLSGNLDCEFGFTGFYFHSLSGFNFSRPRAYDSVAGEWLSRDPIQEQGGTNLYGYVGNNPITYRDPSGSVWGIDWLDNPSFDAPLQSASNFSAGFGDGLSLGLTKLARGGLGWDDVVDKCSGSYNTGWYSGFAYSFALPGVGSLNGGARSVFYSGEGALAAARLSKGGKVILSETLGGKTLTAINAPEWAFRGASAIFAANAKGEAQVFLRFPLRSGAIWHTEEAVLNWLGNAKLIFR